MKQAILDRIKALGGDISKVKSIGLLFFLIQGCETTPDQYEIKENTVLYSYLDNSGIGLTDGYRSDTLEGTPDIKTFKQINEQYAKDKNHVWFRKYLIEEADVKTFTLFLNQRGYYSKDKNHVYSFDQPISNDPNTFKWLTYGYTKDKNHVYYDDKVVALAKPASFQCSEIGNGYAKDDEHVFYQGVLIDDVDVKTFSIEYNHTYKKDGSTVTHIDSPIVKDARSVFHKGKKVRP